MGVSTDQRIQIFNSLSGSKEEFIPIDDQMVGMCMFVDPLFTTMFTLEIAEHLSPLISYIDTLNTWATKSGMFET